MPYIGPNGNVVEKRSPWRFSIITDFFQGIYDVLALFVRAVLHPPQLDQGTSRSARTYGERNGPPGHARRNGATSARPLGGTGGGSNIRGLKNLQGHTNAPAGGG